MKMLSFARFVCRSQKPLVRLPGVGQQLCKLSSSTWQPKANLTAVKASRSSAVVWLETKCVTSCPGSSRVLARFASTDKDSDHKKTLDDVKLDEGAKPSLYQRFKAMYKDYWYVLLPVHVATSCVWFGTFFYAARSGFDIAGALEILNLSEEIMEKVRSSANSTAGHITISYLLYKIFTPLRYTVTLGGTTYTIKYLTARGLLKKMPKKEEIKRMIVEKKDSLKDKRDNFKKEIGNFSPKKK